MIPSCRSWKRLRAELRKGEGPFAGLEIYVHLGGDQTKGPCGFGSTSSNARAMQHQHAIAKVPARSDRPFPIKPYTSTRNPDDRDTSRLQPSPFSQRASDYHETRLHSPVPPPSGPSPPPKNPSRRCRISSRESVSADSQRRPRSGLQCRGGLAVGRPGDVSRRQYEHVSCMWPAESPV
jgi:hypothetical protein